MRKQEIKWWQSAALADWSGAESLGREGNLSLAAFHLHQAAEKILKAVCVAHKRPGFTHICVDLLLKIRSFGIDVHDDLMYAARRLDPHYIESRYPNSVGGEPSRFYDERIISELRECTMKLMSFAESQLSSKSGSTT